MRMVGIYHLCTVYIDYSKFNVYGQCHVSVLYPEVVSLSADGVRESFLLASLNDLLYQRSDGFPCWLGILMLIRPHPPFFLTFKLPNILYLQLALLNSLE